MNLPSTTETRGRAIASIRDDMRRPNADAYYDGGLHCDDLTEREAEAIERENAVDILKAELSQAHLTLVEMAEDLRRVAIFRKVKEFEKVRELARKAEELAAAMKEACDAVLP